MKRKYWIVIIFLALIAGIAWTALSSKNSNQPSEISTEQSCQPIVWTVGLVKFKPTTIWTLQRFSKSLDKQWEIVHNTTDSLAEIDKIQKELELKLTNEVLDKRYEDILYKVVDLYAISITGTRQYCSNEEIAEAQSDINGFITVLAQKESDFNNDFRHELEYYLRRY
jgi:hypothetical protein